MLDALHSSAFLWKKGPRVSSTRWFAWVQGMTWLSPQWTSKLAAYTYVGLQEGFVKPGETCNQLDGLTLRSDSAAGGSTAHGKKAVDAMRDRCKNSVCLCTHVLGNNSIKHASRSIMFALEPDRLWYEDLARDLKGQTASKALQVDLAVGERALHCARSSLDWLTDARKLELCGVAVEKLAEMDPAKMD